MAQTRKRSAPDLDPDPEPTLPLGSVFTLTADEANALRAIRRGVDRKSALAVTIPFLIDEDLPRSLAAALRKDGLAADDVRDLGLRGQDDANVFFS